MAGTPEGKVKKQVVTQLKAMGAYHFFPVTGGYGSSGVPDIVGCYDGGFFGIECKAGRGKPTLLQLQHLRKIRAAGGTALLINETNAATVVSLVASKQSNIEGYDNA